MFEKEKTSSKEAWSDGFFSHLFSMANLSSGLSFIANLIEQQSISRLYDNPFFLLSPTMLGDNTKTRSSLTYLDPSPPPPPPPTSLCPPSWSSPAPTRPHWTCVAGSPYWLLLDTACTTEGSLAVFHWHWWRQLLDGTAVLFRPKQSTNQLICYQLSGFHMQIDVAMFCIFGSNARLLLLPPQSVETGQSNPMLWFKSPPLSVVAVYLAEENCKDDHSAPVSAAGFLKA